MLMLIGHVMLAAVFTGLLLLKVAEMVPHLRLKREISPDELGLPSNATSIRESISTSFSCDGRTYGYYADPENDCQVFHVCLPVHYDDGEDQTFKWSFICPQETVFNQETFTCAREEDAVACEDSALFYSLNDRFGQPNTVPPPAESTDQVPPVDSNELVN